MQIRKYEIVNTALGWLCFAVAALTYLLTVEPTASFWDCPEFISQGAKLEVGHPPGNPYFIACGTLLRHAFRRGDEPRGARRQLYVGSA